MINTVCAGIATKFDAVKSPAIMRPASVVLNMRVDAGQQALQVPLELEE